MCIHTHTHRGDTVPTNNHQLYIPINISSGTFIVWTTTLACKTLFFFFFFLINLKKFWERAFVTLKKHKWLVTIWIQDNIYYSFSLLFKLSLIKRRFWWDKWKEEKNDCPDVCAFVSRYLCRESVILWVLRVGVETMVTWQFFWVMSNKTEVVLVFFCLTFKLFHLN